MHHLLKTHVLSSGVHFRPLLLLWYLLIPGLTDGQEIRVLPDEFNADLAQQMMRSYLREKTENAMNRRQAELEQALLDEVKLADYQERKRRVLLEALGEMPSRTPLNPLVTGVIQCQDYTIEKILYESQPGFFVTANLYRPDGDGRFPAILHSCGHSENGKAASAYQFANQLFVQHGFIVLCYDPIGQAERKQLTSAGEPLQRGTSEHQRLGVAPILLGQSLASYMVWDGIRGIDYLCSRPDVDASKIGCTGNSGGGNLTSYLMAYDQRVAAAAPGCFITTNRRKNESPGPGDAEQNLYAQLRDGLDHADFILVRAPKPTLILSASFDFVPITGTWEAFRQAKRVYTQLGYPERIDLVEAPVRHGYSRRLREGAVRFFARWLQGRQLEAFEQTDDAEALVLSDELLQVTPRGQVLLLEHSRPIFELFKDLWLQSQVERVPPTQSVVRKIAGIRRIEEIPSPRVQQVGTDELRQRLVLSPEQGIVLPVAYWPGGSEVPVLLATDKGINSAALEAEQLHASGHPVAIVDIRDTGETATNNWRFPGADYYIAYMLGQSWIGMRTEDLLVSARWLAESEGRKTIELRVDGEIVPAGLHAAAVEPRLIADLKTRGGLQSWQQLLSSRDAYEHLPNVIHGALKAYDLGDLRMMINRGE